MGRPAVLKIDILTDAKGVKKGTDEAESRLSKFGSNAAKFGKAAALGLAGAAVAVAGVATVAVKAASEQQQAFGALDSIYGNNSKQVKAWAKGAADAVGLSATEYGNLSAIVGSQLRNMGRSQQAAAKDSDGLIRMGADLAATFGGSVSDAVEAVSSLLKGERDPIERYGVSIKQADINARLAALGQDKLKGSALATAQANATLYLLTKQTAAAHGSFAKESNTLAGQQERLKAQFSNVKATVGTALLPVLTQLFTWVNARLVPTFKRLADQVGPYLQPILAGVSGFVRGTVVPTLQRLGGYVTGTLVPAFRSYLVPYLAGAREGFAKVQAAVERNRPQLESLGRAIGTVVTWLAKHLAPILGTIAGTQFKVLGAVIGGVIGTIGGLVDGVKAAVDWIGRMMDKIDGLVSKARNVHLPDLNPFSAVGVIGMVPELIGPGVSYAPGGSGLATAALGTSSSSGGGYTMRAAAAGAVVIDRRDQRVTIDVHGALDPVGVARQIRALLDDQAARLGTAPAWAGGF